VGILEVSKWNAVGSIRLDMHFGNKFAYGVLTQILQMLENNKYQAH
jgi:hypothetical protein